MFLTAEARTTYSRGFIYNLVTNDTDAIQMLCNQIFTLFSAPLRIIVAMVLLYQQIGVAAFAALVLLLCTIPAQVRCRYNMSFSTRQRLRMLPQAHDCWVARLSSIVFSANLRLCEHLEVPEGGHV